MGTGKHDQGSADRMGRLFLSGLNVAAAVIGVATPVYGFAAKASVGVLKAALAVETVVVVWVLFALWRERRSYLRLRRADARRMADPSFFAGIHDYLQEDLTAGLEAIAEGRVRVFAAQVLDLSKRLMQVLSQMANSSRVVLATDLTVDPSLLSTRMEYLKENRQFIEGGGTIKRLFICRRADLLERDFAVKFLELAKYHRSLGVRCGLAVREGLRPDQIVDFIVFGSGAVLIEDQQGDASYSSGRSTAEFKLVNEWTTRFEAMWPAVKDTPMRRLEAYEAAARMLLDEGRWDATRLGTVLDTAD